MFISLLSIIALVFETFQNIYSIIIYHKASRMKTVFSSDVWKQSFHLMRTTDTNRSAHLYYLSLSRSIKDENSVFIWTLSQSIKDENSVFITCHLWKQCFQKKCFHHMYENSVFIWWEPLIQNRSAPLYNLSLSQSIKDENNVFIPWMKT